jgi:hypothetical protein
MKRIIIAASVITAVAAGGYWVSQQPNNGFTNSYDALAYIPANTAIFSGQLEPFPVRSYLNSVADNYKNTSDEMIEEFYSSSEYDPEDKRVKFFISLTKSYMDSMESADKFIATMGVAEQMRGYVYTLGMVPVLKLEVTKPEAIWALLDKAELDSGFSHEQRQLKELTYRAYTLSEPDDEETIELVFAQQNDFLTVTFNTSLNETALLETAFGLAPVEESLATTNTIDDIIKTHGFSDNSIGYINHQAIVNALTAPNESMLGKQIAKLLAKQNDKSLQVLQTPACQTELPAIAANWPRTVFGMNSLSITDNESTFDMSMVVESHNNAILSALKQLTGFIPSYVKDIDNTVFAMGIGLDVAQVSPAINAIWNDLQQPSYQCQPLQQIQHSISQQNPAMLGMMASMANGVKGLGFSVLDYSLDETKTEPALKDLDALVSLSADDPRALFNMVAAFKPELSQIKLPENNTVVELASLMPLPPVPGVNVKLLITDDHMIIFTGDKAAKAAQNLGKEPLVSNGIYNLSLDYSKAFTPIVSMAEMSGQELPDEVAAFKDYDVRLNTGLSVNEKGIVVNSYMNAKAAPTAVADAK